MRKRLFLTGMLITTLFGACILPVQAQVGGGGAGGSGGSSAGAAGPGGAGASGGGAAGVGAGGAGVGATGNSGVGAGPNGTNRSSASGVGQAQGDLNLDANRSDGVGARNQAGAAEGGRLDAGVRGRNDTNIGQQPGTPALNDDIRDRAGIDSRHRAGTALDTDPDARIRNGHADIEGNADLDNRTGVDADARASANNSAGPNATSDTDNLWRLRQHGGQWWYWLGDRGNGRWAFYDNGRWNDYTRGVYLQPQRHQMGYRGTNRYDGPYFFDGDGRRYSRDAGGGYLQDQSWNTRVWNEDYGTRYRGYSSGSGARVGANIGGTIGNAIHGQSGGQIGAGIGGVIGRGN